MSTLSSRCLVGSSNIYCLPILSLYSSVVCQALSVLHQTVQPLPSSSQGRSCLLIFPNFTKLNVLYPSFSTGTTLTTPTVLSVSLVGLPFLITTPQPPWDMAIHPCHLAQCCTHQSLYIHIPWMKPWEKGTMGPNSQDGGLRKTNRKILHLHYVGNCWLLMEKRNRLIKFRNLSNVIFRLGQKEQTGSQPLSQTPKETHFSHKVWTWTPKGSQETPLWEAALTEWAFIVD